MSIILIIGIFDNINKELYLPNVYPLSVNIQPSAPIMYEHSLI